MHLSALDVAKQTTVLFVLLILISLCTEKVSLSSRTTVLLLLFAPLVITLWIKALL